MAAKRTCFSTAELVLNLKPHLEDFLRHEMKSPEGPIMLTRDNDVGKYIYSQVTVLSTPPKKVKMTNPVTISIPVTMSNKHIIRYRFLFISRWGEEKIKDFLEAEFRLRMRLLFEAGYQKRYTQKEIIESILQAYNIRNSAVSFDAIKKADYRNKRLFRKSIYEDLQSAVR